MSLARFGATFTAAALRQTSVAIAFVLTDIKRYAMQIANFSYRFTISWHWMLIYPKYWTATRDVIGLYIHYILEYRRKDDLTENLARGVENFAALFRL